MNMNYMGVTQAMIEAASEVAAGTDDEIRMVLEAGIPSRIESINAARAAGPQYGTATINEMLDAAIKAAA